LRSPRTGVASRRSGPTSGSRSTTSRGGRSRASFAPVDFTSDGRTLFAYAYTTVPASLFRIDVESGRQTFEAELAPPDRTGLYAIPAVHVSMDGTEVAYSFVRILSELYLVDGLK